MVTASGEPLDDDAGAAAPTPAPAGDRVPEEIGRPSILLEPPGDDAFERRLTREILISERLRVQILAAIPGLALILFLAATASNPDAVDKAFDGKMDRLRVGLLLGSFATYELWALYTVERLIRTDREPPVWRRYVNALVEASLPTCVVLYYMAFTSTDPVASLLLPAPFIYFVFILLSTLRLDFMLCLFTGAVAAIEYAVLSLVVIESGRWSYEYSVFASKPHHLGKALVLFVSGVAAGFVARRLRTAFINTLRSVEERRNIVDLFGQHVSPAVVDQLLLRKADAKSEVRSVCVMFLDIRNFTAFSEKRSPEEVVGYLNSLFGFMIESVNANHGFVNKFLGDGFMAIFGAPLSDGEDCRHAVDAALDILAKLDAMTAEVPDDAPPTSKSLPLALTRVGIGIHTGKAVVGNVGSATRKEYTVIGDVVNVASRLETLNKELGTRLLVTEEVWSAAERPGVPAEAKEPLKVRGRAEPIRIYAIG